MRSGAVSVKKESCDECWLQGNERVEVGELEHQIPPCARQHRRDVQTRGNLFVSLVCKLKDVACSNATSVGVARVGSRKPSEMQRAVAGLIQDEVSMHIKHKYDSIRGRLTSMIPFTYMRTMWPVHASRLTGSNPSSVLRAQDGRGSRAPLLELAREPALLESSFDAPLHLRPHRLESGMPPDPDKLGSSVILFPPQLHKFPGLPTSWRRRRVSPSRFPVAIGSLP